MCSSEFHMRLKIYAVSVLTYVNTWKTTCQVKKSLVHRKNPDWSGCTDKSCLNYLQAEFILTVTWVSISFFNGVLGLCNRCRNLFLFTSSDCEWLWWLLQLSPPWYKMTRIVFPICEYSSDLPIQISDYCCYKFINTVHWLYIFIYLNIIWV